MNPKKVDPDEILKHCCECKRVYVFRQLIKIDVRKLVGTKTFIKPVYYCSECYRIFQKQTN